MQTLPKLSFCLTEEEVQTVDEARKRLGKHGVLRNRSEVIRVAIACLWQLDDEALQVAAERTPQLKPGRKRKGSEG